VYVITDRRAITFVGGLGMTIRSYPPEKLQEVYRREKRDGTGDVIIVRRAWYDPDGDRRSEELGFLRIANPKEVENLLKRLADQAQTGPAEPQDESCRLSTGGAMGDVEGVLSSLFAADKWRRVTGPEFAGFC
jgi:hypothetical protein